MDGHGPPPDTSGYAHDILVCKRSRLELPRPSGHLEHANASTNSSEAHISTSAAVSIADHIGIPATHDGKLYPLDLSDAQRSHMLGSFLRRHPSVALDSWDTYREVDGYISLGWYELGLSLAAGVVLSLSQYDVAIARKNPDSRARAQDLRVSNDYQHSCADLVAVLHEIAAYREQKKSRSEPRQLNT